MGSLTRLDQGKSYLEDGRYEKAADLFSKIINQNDQTADEKAHAHYFRAECRKMSQQYSLARSDFNTGIYFAQSAGDAIPHKDEFISECKMKIADTFIHDKVYRSADQTYADLLEDYPTVRIRDSLLFRRYICALKLGDDNPEQYLDKITSRRNFNEAALRREFIDGNTTTRFKSYEFSGRTQSNAKNQKSFGNLIILSRKAWSALPSKSNIDMMTRINKITVHHTADIMESTSYADSARRMLSYQKHHQGPSNGWADIGYHFIIDRAGRIWEGRLLKFQGAHAGTPEKNMGNIGVSLMGDFNEQKLTESQKESLTDLLIALCDKYNLSRSKMIFTHREVHPTDCPGANLQTFVNEFCRNH